MTYVVNGAAYKVSLPPRIEVPSTEMWGLISHGRSGIAGTNKGEIIRPVATSPRVKQIGKLHLGNIPDITTAALVDADETGRKLQPIWALSDAVIRATRDLTVVVGNHSVSGRNIPYLFNPADASGTWNKSMAWIDRFVELAQAEGKTPIIPYVFWSHNWDDNAYDYETAMRDAYSRFNAAIRARTGQTFDPEWWVEQGSRNDKSSKAHVVMHDDPAMRYTLMESRLVEQSRHDTVHFTQLGGIRQVERQGLIWSKVLSGGWQPLRLASAAVSGSVVTFTFSGAPGCGPIYVNESGWHGLEINDADGAVPLSNFAITGPRTCTATIGRTLAANARAGCAWTGALWPERHVDTLWGDSHVYSGIRCSLGIGPQTGQLVELGPIISDVPVQ